MEMDGGSDSIIESLWVKLPGPRSTVIVGRGAIILRINILRGKCRGKLEAGGILNVQRN